MRAVIFSSIIFICLVVGSVQAQNVTFSDLNIQKGIKILVYTADGRLVGEFNTTDTVNLDPNHDYIFVLKPSEQAWFSNPFQAVELFKASVPAFLSYALFLVVFVASAYIIKKAIVG